MHGAIVSSPKGPKFYWNLNGAVGKNGVNNRDDVLFVTWCFYKMAKQPDWQPDLVKKLQNAGITENCTGRDDDRVVVAIKAVQQAIGLMMDGRVSSITKGGQYIHSGGKSTFLIIYLNSVLANSHPAQWPRIDQMPEFIWRIRDQATTPFNWV